MAEGRLIGNSPFQVQFSRKNSRFRKRTLSLRWEKEKAEFALFPGNPTVTFLVNLTAFCPRFAGEAGLGQAFLLVLGMRLARRVVREVLKIGID